MQGMQQKQKNQQNQSQPIRLQSQNRIDNDSDIIMIDLDSSDNNTQPNQKGSQEPYNFVDLVGDDEWMSDDNLDTKIDHLRKKVR